MTAPKETTRNAAISHERETLRVARFGFNQTRPVRPKPKVSSTSERMKRLRRWLAKVPDGVPE